jgi:hypothetical protein
MSIFGTSFFLDVQTILFSAMRWGGEYLKDNVVNSKAELYNLAMEIVSDASAFLAVALNEIDRDWVIEKTSGFSIVSPEVLP